MLLAVASCAQSYVSPFHLAHYITVRIVGSMLTSLFLSLIFGNMFIKKSTLLFSSSTRPFTPENHKQKDKTPTMGGLFIVMITLCTMMLWSDWSKSDVWLFVLTLCSFGTIGFIDDWSKIQKTGGIAADTKFRLQITAGLFIALLMMYLQRPTCDIWFPFFKSAHVNLGYFFIPWVVFVLIGTSNAVNLTDGLDGLAIGALISNFSVFSIIAYLAGHFTFAQYLQIPFSASSEVAVLGSILVGASLGFLWFNAHPAQIFMGDVGSLSLGATLALMALLTKQELVLPISGGLFVFETLSVMAQMASWKLYKKRLFKMAPIHHHFELLGWNETKITVRFNIISFVLCLLALITLKMR